MPDELEPVSLGLDGLYPIDLVYHESLLDRLGFSPLPKGPPVIVTFGLYSRGLLSPCQAELSTEIHELWIMF
jgi:hypothetical protein